jgi:preprotein translocase subunit YajC
MQNNFLWPTTPGLGLIAEATPLPNAVPGIGSGGGAAGGASTATGDPASGGAGAAPPPSPFGNTIFIMFALVLVFMIVSTMMSSRKAKKQAAEMLGSLKRGDRVLTTAGILGTVHEVRDDAVVLRIDDVNGTKVHFAKHAVQQVVKSGKGGGKTADATTDADGDEEPVAQAG